PVQLTGHKTPALSSSISCGLGGTRSEVVVVGGVSHRTAEAATSRERRPATASHVCNNAAIRGDSAYRWWAEGRFRVASPTTSSIWWRYELDRLPRPCPDLPRTARRRPWRRRGTCLPVPLRDVSVLDPPRDRERLHHRMVEH